MNLKSACWILLVSLMATLSSLADPTNSVVSTNSSGTNVITEAKPPGDIYTNSIDMVLLKMPGGFWAGKYEVTQKEYQKVMGANPSAFAGEKNPVDSIAWGDAVEFCAKMSALDVESNSIPKGYTYMLPTEDEWESLVGDASLDNSVTSQNASRGSSAQVGSLQPNSLGLYDVRGNVLEFCLGDTAKPYRVLRGGCWQDHIEINLRTAFRNYVKPDEAKNTFGFRCILKHQ